LRIESPVLKREKLGKVSKDVLEGLNNSFTSVSTTKMALEVLAQTLLFSGPRGGSIRGTERRSWNNQTVQVSVSCQVTMAYSQEVSGNTRMKGRHLKKKYFFSF